MTFFISCDTITIKNQARSKQMKHMDFCWIPFYTEFATKLLQYKNNRNLLIEKIISIFQNLHTKTPTLEKENALQDIDPFTIFGLFNKGITDANRIAILKQIAKLFDGKSTTKL